MPAIFLCPHGKNRFTCPACRIVRGAKRQTERESRGKKK